MYRDETKEIRIGDRVLDASISTQLQGLKKELLQVQIGL